MKRDFYFSVKLPEGLSNIPVVRRMSRDALRAFGVAPNDTDDIEAVIGELATNAVCHAHNHTFNVELVKSDSLVVITVSDSGIGFSKENSLSPGTARLPEYAGDEPRIGGWGIPLVIGLMDRVDFYQNYPRGTIVRVEKRLQHAA